MQLFRAEFRDLVRLALPIATVQMGMMGMSVVDVAMVGRLSEDALAGLTIGNSYGFLILQFGLGVLMALDPIISQALGADDEPAVIRGVQRSVLLALLLSVPVGLLWFFADTMLGLLGQRQALIPIASDYLLAMIPGIVAFYLFFALRLSLQAMHRLRPIVVTIVLANVANVGLDWALIHGKFGLPALGATGCGWATTICRWLMLGGLLVLGWPTFGARLRASWSESMRLASLLNMLRIGAPIGLQGTIEAAAFATVAFSMGWLGPTEVGGHMVALQYAAFAFMVPVGVSSAAAVRVGWGVGRQDMPAIRRSAVASLLAGGLVMVISATLFLAIPGPLARVFTDIPEVIPVAIALLPIAGFFQVFDGLQVVASGVLRGIGDVRFPMLVNVGGFWLTGLPLGWILTFQAGMGPRGLWWGLVLGLGLVAVVLMLRIRNRLQGEIARVEG